MLINATEEQKMNAYLRFEGTIIVRDEKGNAVIEFFPVKENGEVVGKLPVMVGAEILAAINKCYRDWVWPEIPSSYEVR